MKVAELMKKAVAVDKNISVKDAARIMSSKGIGSLIIIEKNKIVGIVTERDVLKNIGNLGSKLANIMSKNVITISSKKSVDEAAEIMAENKIKRLPVVDAGELVGIITATDLLAHSDALNEDFLIE